MNAVLHDKIVPLYNEEIFDEYNDVLNRSKFHFSKDLICNYLETIRRKGIPSGRIHSNEIFPDNDDVVFYEVALSKEDAYLVTGNIKHFPKTPIVVTPAELLEIMQQHGIL